ncbi:hypothetical protein [Aequorivita lipolytica]|uniref:TonB C-terminal domain-containing protein n=1 Tax=Aequorivita lipolytica TaxID=153267 RepID=A0A5C6YPJ5_9FLAO|nr:hypothetical protein [Aequorivita lipolytica]TXD69261.1 hypothetical protein ESV24_07825 [Aequorivita lipolytica]SRX50119.1 hypothetical protein AEQU2_00586 [Aequorivita lipolytica]
MKNGFIFLLLLLVATSCQFFETEKVSSDEIYKEEMQTIDWKEVDRYPSFSNCENSLEKPEQKDCFISTISSHLYQSISHEEMVAVREIYDTVKVNFEISSNGKLSILEIKMDTLLQKEFPDLEKWLLQSIDSLKPVAPAYKRGIPVKTQFTLPVIIQTN